MLGIKQPYLLGKAPVDLREMEQMVEDLETRLDRLRALYDQYFMGFERLEPLVPRKEVDRKIYILRKEQIRNTGLRFRFNMLIQRYNTFQTHWARICRQIEDGTYKHHVLRAKRRFEDNPRSVPPRSEFAPSIVPLAASESPTEREVDFEIDFAVSRPDGQGDELDPPTRPGTLRSPFSAPALPSIPMSALVGEGASSTTTVNSNTLASALTTRAPQTIRGIGPTPSQRPPPLPSTASRRPPPLPPSVRPAPPPSTTQASPGLTRPPPAPKSEPSDATLQSGITRSARPIAENDRVESLYGAYLDQKRVAGDNSPVVSLAKMKRTVIETETRLKERHGREVDFRVEIVDGKAVLRPILK